MKKPLNLLSFKQNSNTVLHCVNPSVLSQHVYCRSVMPSEDRIKDIIFHYQLIRERVYPGNYFLDIQLVTYFSIYSIFSLLFPSLPTCSSPTSQVVSVSMLCFPPFLHELPNSFPYSTGPFAFLPTICQKERRIWYSQEAAYPRISKSSEVDPYQPSNGVNSLEKVEQQQCKSLFITTNKGN